MVTAQKWRARYYSFSLLGAFYYTRRSIMVITSACGAEDESSILFGRISYLKIFSYHVIIYYKVK